MAIRNNAYQISARIAARGPAVEREVVAELDVQARKLADGLRERAPKFQSLIVQSTKITALGPYTREIAVNAAHGVYQELGIKPGGRGLPRFNDPASAAIVAWLRSKLAAGRPRVRKGSARAALAETELRDRYEGLALHVRAHGIKASPFVRPTFEAMQAGVSSALVLAVRRGLAADGGATA